jgi:hypothetical protein
VVACAAPFTVTIDPAPLAVTTTSLPAATAGRPYTATLASSGGVGTASWAVASGSALPAGLTMTADGVINGTPTAAGTVTSTVQVRDLGGPSPNSITKDFTLTVNPPPPLSIGVDALPTGVPGQPYRIALHATGGSGGYTWSLAPGSVLPAGLTLGPDGSIGGTPTATGEAEITVQVTDAAAPPHTATRTYTVYASAALPGSTTRLYPGGNGDGLTAGVSGSTVGIGPSGAPAADMWTFTPIGGAYELVDALSGRCLSTDGVAGNAVRLESCTGVDGQLWQISGSYGGESSTTSWVRNPASDRYLNVRGDQVVVGAVVDVAPWSGTPTQSFFPVS